MGYWTNVAKADRYFYEIPVTRQLVVVEQESTENWRTFGMYIKFRYNITMSGRKYVSFPP